jgi:hypothetical protein
MEQAMLTVAFHSGNEPQDQWQKDQLITVSKIGVGIMVINDWYGNYC